MSRKLELLLKIRSLEWILTLEGLRWYIYIRWMCGIELMINSSVLINLGPSKYVLFIDKDRDVCTNFNSNS